MAASDTADHVVTIVGARPVIQHACSSASSTTTAEAGAAEVSFQTVSRLRSSKGVIRVFRQAGLGFLSANTNSDMSSWDRDAALS